MTNHNAARNIRNGISFLMHAQLSDGGFESFSSPSLKNFKCEKTYRSTFPVALTLSCLNEVKSTPIIRTSDVRRQSERIMKDAARFLLAQKSEHWSFNYWVRGSEEAARMPYPDDLDDTFCTLSALYSHNADLIDASVLAKVVSLLTFTEEKEGGPYRTWLMPPDAVSVWKDTDLAVNANIAYFLSLQGVDLPELISFVEQAIDDERYSSPYYPSPYSIIYFISRFYAGEKKESVRKFLLRRQNQNGGFGNPLDTALAVSALLRLGADSKPVEKSVRYLSQMQKNGAWEAEAFCLDPALGGKPYYAGSSALTTAFCLEALALYEKAAAQKNAASAADKKTRALRDEVVKRAQKKFSALDTELRAEAIDRLDKTLLGDKDGTIALLPFFFAASLGNTARKVPHELVVSLCLANLYGWMAYTIYDDFLDDEGDPKLLSFANVCLRELAGIFLQVGNTYGGFSRIFTKTMDKLDSTNAWEIAHCRMKNTRDIPDYGNFSRLAERSFGHALGPLAILSSLGYSAASTEIKHAKKFFEEYLIARQLNDDAHDWEKDLNMGHINSVGAMLLGRSGKKTVPKILAKEDIAALQKLFWNETIDKTAEEILARGRSARKHLQKMKSVKDRALFEKMLLPVENAAKEALREKERTLAFLKAY